MVHTCTFWAKPFCMISSIFSHIKVFASNSWLSTPFSSEVFKTYRDLLETTQPCCIRKSTSSSRWPGVQYASQHRASFSTTEKNASDQHILKAFITALFWTHHGWTFQQRLLCYCCMNNVTYGSTYLHYIY